MSLDRGYEEILEEISGGGSIDLYGEDAELFDLLYSRRPSRDLKEESARNHAEEDSEVLDLACGTGIVAESVDDDYSVTGADVSREMLEVARDKDLDADFVQADMTDLPFHEEFDAVLMYGQPFSHVTDKSKVRKAASSIYECLRDGGILVTDVFAPEAGRMDDAVAAETEFDENHRVVQSWEFSNYREEDNTWDAKSTFTIDRYNFITNREYRRELRGYSSEEIHDTLTDAGFSTVEEEEIYPARIYNGFRAVK